MKTHHTPGPWVVSLFPNLVGAIDDGGERETVAETVGPNKEANARLIAAAPELLEALTKAVAYLQANRPAGKISEIFSKLNELENGVIKPARAAIAKATSVPSASAVA